MRLNIFIGIVTLLLGVIFFFLQFIIFPLDGYLEMRITFGFMALFTLYPMMFGIGLIGIGIGILFSKVEREE